MKNNRMLKFLTLTFLISWTCWWGEALLVKTTGLTQVDIIPMIIFTIGGFGPTIAACFCLDEKFSLKALFRFVFRRERKTAGYLFLFLFLEIATFVLSSMELNSAISISLIPLIILQAIITIWGQRRIGMERDYATYHSGKILISDSNINNWSRLGCVAYTFVVY
ncbi:MAG: hypothetical protein WAO23_07495 [Dethiobacteria bacterium]